MRGSPLLSAKFHPHRCNVSPLRSDKPQNRPLSKLNNRRFALREMLPVNYYYKNNNWLQFLFSVTILKIENLLYLKNGSADLREIWQDDAYCAFELDRKLKF